MLERLRPFLVRELDREKLEFDVVRMIADFNIDDTIAAFEELPHQLSLSDESGSFKVKIKAAQEHRTLTITKRSGSINERVKLFVGRSVPLIQYRRFDTALGKGFRTFNSLTALKHSYTLIEQAGKLADASRAGGNTPV